MKNQGYIKILIIAILLLFNGCGNSDVYIVSTKIFADGSCARNLKVEYNNEDNSDEYPFVVDSSWTEEMIIDTSEEKPDTFLLFSKKFESVKEMNKMNRDTGYLFSVVDREITLRKKFRWFYTEYVYTDEYSKLFEGEPYTNYLTTEEIRYFFYDEESPELFEGMDSLEIEAYEDTIELKWGEWMNETMFHIMYNALMVTIDQNDSLQIYRNEIENIKDGLKDWFNWGEADGGDLFGHIDMLVDADSAIIALQKNPTGHLKEVMDKLEFFDDTWFSYGLKYDLEMPGLLTSTNADSVKNRIMYFDVSWEKYFTSNYKMKAVSKIKNIWAYYVSGGIALFALVALISGVVRKLRKK